MIINLGRMLPHASSDLPETTRAALWSLFSLASDGVYTAISVTRDAVVSYTAFSPLPLRAVIFCCTFPGVASAGRYPASCPVKPGLSSIFHAIIRPTHIVYHVLKGTVCMCICPGPLQRIRQTNCQHSSNDLRHASRKNHPSRSPVSNHKKM